MVLVQISVESMTNDEQMFRRIREEYETARRENPWHVSIPSPKWFSKFCHRFVVSLPDLPRVAAMFKPMKKAWTGHLYQVSNGDFVRVRRRFHRQLQAADVSHSSTWYPSGCDSRLGTLRQKNCRRRRKLMNCDAFMIHDRWRSSIMTYPWITSWNRDSTLMTFG